MLGSGILSTISNFFFQDRTAKKSSSKVLASVKRLSEHKRGCGYRTPGGLYLIALPGSVSCHRLPLALLLCPCCGGGIKFSRGFRWLPDPKEILKSCEPITKCECVDKKSPLTGGSQPCFVCYPREVPAGLMWVGERFYTPGSFAAEARKMGVCKKIASVPKDLKLGETIIYLAHRKAAPIDAETAEPGIFHAFIPQEVQLVIEERKAGDEKYISRLEKRGITPVIVDPIPEDKNGDLFDGDN